ncbi:hypothetical protein AOLI_G00099250 [Acnodon oligacanthus]
MRVSSFPTDDASPRCSPHKPPASQSTPASKSRTSTPAFSSTSHFVVIFCWFTQTKTSESENTEPTITELHQQHIWVVDLIKIEKSSLPDDATADAAM